MDWLSRLFEMMPVRGLDLRSWRIDQGPGEANEIPYQLATLEDPGERQADAAESRRLCFPATHGTSCTTAAGPRPCRPQPRVPQLHDQRKSRIERRLDLLLRTLSPSRHRTIACSAAICRRALSCMPALTLDRTTRHAARRPCLPDAERVRGRPPRRPRNAERVVDGDVRACAAARK